MADRKLIYEVGFKTDQNSLKNTVNQAMQSLNKLNLDLTINPTGFTEAKNAAQDLQRYMSTAIDTKTGELSLSKLSQSLKKSGMTLKDYQAQFDKLGVAGQKAFGEIVLSIQQAQPAIRQSSLMMDKLMTTFGNTARWMVTSSILTSITGAISSAFSYAKDLDKTLTDIQIVSEKSANDMQKFAKEANNAAKALHTTTNEYARASLIYFQQGGLTDDQIRERTETTIKMSQITGDSVETASSYMTAIWNNFANGSKNVEYYADVITKLGAATASSSSEIANGLEKFSSVADMIGLSYEYATTALATVVAQTRQSEDTVGTAFRTIFSRLQGLQLGETLDDGVTLNKYSEALAKVGVNIIDANGNLINMDGILNQLGERWGELSEKEQTALAQTVGGQRQYANLVALLDNWDTFQENLEIAMNAEGTVDKQAEIYADSWEAASNEVKAAAEDIYDSLINDDFFIDLTKGAAGFLNILGDVIDGMGGLEGILASTAMWMTRLSQQKISGALLAMSNNVRDFFVGSKEGTALKEEADNIPLKGFGVSTRVEQQDNINRNIIENNKASGKYGQQQIAQQEQLANLQAQIGKISVEEDARLQKALKEKQKNKIVLDEMVKKEIELNKEQEEELENLIKRKKLIVLAGNDSTKIQEEINKLNQNRQKYNINEIENLQEKNKRYQQLLYFSDQAENLTDTEFNQILAQMKESEVDTDGINTKEDLITRLQELEQEIDKKVEEMMRGATEEEKRVINSYHTKNARNSDTYLELIAEYLDQQYEKLGQDFRNSINNPRQDWAQITTSVVNNLMGAASTISGINGLVSTIEEGTFNISSLMGSMMTILPSIIMLISNISKPGGKIGLIIAAIGTIISIIDGINTSTEEAVENIDNSINKIKENNNLLKQQEDTIKNIQNQIEELLKLGDKRTLQQNTELANLEKELEYQQQLSKIENQKILSENEEKYQDIINNADSINPKDLFIRTSNFQNTIADNFFTGANGNLTQAIANLTNTIKTEEQNPYASQEVMANYKDALKQLENGKIIEIKFSKEFYEAMESRTELGNLADFSDPNSNSYKAFKVVEERYLSTLKLAYEGMGENRWREEAYGNVMSKMDENSFSFDSNGNIIWNQDFANVYASQGAYKDSELEAWIKEIYNTIRDSNFWKKSPMKDKTTPQDFYDIVTAKYIYDNLEILNGQTNNADSNKYYDSPDLLKEEAYKNKKNEEKKTNLQLQVEGIAENLGISIEAFEAYKRILIESGKTAGLTEKEINKLTEANLRSNKSIKTFKNSWNDWNNILKNGTELEKIIITTDEIIPALEEITGFNFDVDYILNNWDIIVKVIKGDITAINEMIKSLGLITLDSYQLELYEEWLSEENPLARKQNPLNSLFEVYNKQQQKLKTSLTSLSGMGKSINKEFTDVFLDEERAIEAQQRIVSQYEQVLDARNESSIENYRKNLEILKTEYADLKAVAESKMAQYDNWQSWYTYEQAQKAALSDEELKKELDIWTTAETKYYEALEGIRGVNDSLRGLEIEKVEALKDEFGALQEKIDNTENSVKHLKNIYESLFGIEKINFLNKITKELENQKKASKDLVDQLNLYKQEMLKTEFLKDFSFIVDSSGAITNGEEIRLQMWQEYEKEIKEINYKLTEEEIKNEQKRIENTYKYRIENLEKVLEVDERITKEIERQYNIIKEQYENQLETIDLNRKQIKELNENNRKINELNKKYKETFAASGPSGVFALLDNDIKKMNLAFADLNIDLASHAELIEKLKYANTAQGMKFLTDQIKELENSIYSSMEELLSYADILRQYIPNAINAANESIEKYTNDLEYYGNIISKTKEIYESFGLKKFSKENKEAIDTALKNAETQISISKKSFEGIENALKAAKNELERAQGEAAIAFAQANYDAIEKEYETAYEALLDSAKKAMDAAKEVFVVAIEEAANTFEQILAGQLGLEYLQESFDKYIETEERYLDTVNSVYEANKLNRSIQQSMDETNSDFASRMLSNLQEEIKQRELAGKLSEYDVKILEAKYQLTLKQIALEEAQNNKSTVRLVRDGNGNWSYQYTSDAEKVNEAQQELDNANNDLYNLAKNRVEETTKEIIGMWNEANKELVEVWNDETLTYEEKVKKTEQIQEFYTKKHNDLLIEQKEAINDLRALGDINTQAYIDDLIEMTSKSDTFEAAFKDYIAKCIEAGSNFENKIDEIAINSGTDIDSLTNKIDGISIAMDKLTSEANLNKITGFWQSIANEISKLLPYFDSLITKMRLLSGINYNNGLSNGLYSDIDYAALIAGYMNITGSTNIDDNIKSLLQLRDNKINVNGLNGQVINNTELIKKLQEDENYRNKAAMGVLDTYKTLTQVGINYTKPGVDYAALISYLVENNVPYDSDAIKVLEQLRYNKMKQENLSSDTFGVEGEKLKNLISSNPNLWTYYSEDTLKEWLKDILKLDSYDKGGYTGNFNGEKLAILHGREYVLKEEDTNKVLGAVQALRLLDPAIFSQIEAALDGKVSAIYEIAAGFGSGLSSFKGNKANSANNYTIYAEFPNATDQNEIRQALLGLPEYAVQKVNKR